jgi:hypothetical protein
LERYGRPPTTIDIAAQSAGGRFQLTDQPTSAQGDIMPAFALGAANPRHQQRTRGPNKLPRDVVAAIIDAGRIKGNRLPNDKGGRSRKGMVHYVASLPDALYVQLLCRVIPRDIGVTMQADVRAAVVTREQRLDEIDREHLALVEEINALPDGTELPPELEERHQRLLLLRGPS